MANTPDPKRLAELAKAWGFIDIALTPKARQMSAPSGGDIIEVKRDIKEARMEDVEKLAAAIDISVERFLAGPDKKKVQATEPRRQVIEFLARQRDRRVYDQSGRATAIVAEGVGGQQTAVAQLLKHMVTDGQVKANRNGKRTYSYELILAGPRVKEMMPLETIPAVNADLPTHETPQPEPESQNGSDVYVPVHRKIDLDNYRPDDIAAALLERVFMVIADGSADVHAKIVSGLEVRLAEQVEFAEREQRKRRKAEEDLAQARTDLARARQEVLDLKRARATIPAEVVDSILVNGQPRVGANRVPQPKGEK